jgi:hypothetical protein
MRNKTARLQSQLEECGGGGHVSGHLTEIASFPLALSPFGTMTVAMVKDGVTRRNSLGGLLSAAVAPHVAAAELTRDEAVAPILLENRFVAADLATARSEGEAHTAEGVCFIAVGEIEGEVEVRIRTLSGSELLYTELTKASLTSTEPGKGAGLVATESGETVQEALDRLRTDAEITMTVGPTGDFGTLNEALAEASTYRRKYKKNSKRVEVQLLSDFLMAEQVLVVSLDLSFITITREGGGEVPVVRESLTDEPPVPGWRLGTKALFGATQGAFLPIIGALFSMDNSGDGVGTCGVVVDQQSYAIILAGCGVKNAGWRGLYGIGGYVYARDTIWDGAGRVATTIGGTPSVGSGIRIANGGGGSIRGASVKNCAMGLYLGSSRVVAMDVNCSGATIVPRMPHSGIGVYLISGCHAQLYNVNCSGAGRHALQLTSGATAWLVGGDLSGAGGSAILMSGGSTVYATGINASGAGSRAVDASGGSVVAIFKSNLSRAGERALSASSASEIKVNGCNLTGAGDASPFRVFSASKISMSSCTLDQTALSSVNSGGEIAIYDCVDEDGNPYVVKGNIPVNTMTRPGILRGIAPTCRETGNSSVSILPSDPALIYLNTPITQDRTHTLPAPGSVHHSGFRFVRTAAATGKFDYVIATDAEIIGTLAPGEWLDVAPNVDQSAWFVTGRGRL